MVALCALLVGLVAAAPASADPNKPYSVVLTAGVGTGGSTVTATFHNENKTQRLGAANLTAPSGYTVTSASLPAGSPGSASVVVVGKLYVVELRNLALAPGQSLTVTINLGTAPCSTGLWSVEAKQANNFNGAGNDLTLDSANSNLLTTFCTAPCNGNTSCTTDASNSKGSAQVSASTGESTGQLRESANAATFAPLTCTGYTSADPNVYDFLTPEDRSKVVTLAINDVPLNGSSPLAILNAQQICFDAPYEFATAPGGPTALAPSDGAGGFVGLLQTCTSWTVGPCHNRTLDTVVTDPANPSDVDITLVADIPSGLLGDPRMG